MTAPDAPSSVLSSPAPRPGTRSGFRFLAPQGPPVVRVSNLNHFFGEGEARKQVLFDNNLELSAGEIVIMTGPSGSGKTTLLTLIGALRSIEKQDEMPEGTSQGTVEVLGRDLSRLKPKELVEIRRGIGFIFQAHNLFASLTAYQNVKMAMELENASAAEQHQRITELLTTLGLGQRIYYKPEKLSGGQKQRVAVARALANYPKLILADEPTAALDKTSGRTVVTLLEKMAREEGCTSMIVTHDNRILDVADRIVNMVDGRIISNVLVAESERICGFLREDPLFSKLSASTLTDVSSKMAREPFGAGSIIIRQGEEGDKVYLLRSGTVDVFVDDGTGNKKVATLKEGQIFGERALITDEPRNATVIAVDAVDTYSLDKATFKAVLDTSPTFKEELRRVLFLRQ